MMLCLRSSGSSALRRSVPVYRTPRAGIQRRLQSDAPKPPQPPKPNTAPAQPSLPAKRALSTSFTPSAILNLPGISWVFAPVLVPIRLLNRSQARRPYLTQFIASIIIFSLADLSTQYVRSPKELAGRFWASVYDPIRSLRAMIVGAVCAIPSYLWFLKLGTLWNIPNQFILSLSLKTLTNQIFFPPINNSYFFGFHCLLAGMIPSANQPTQANLLYDPGRALEEAYRRVADAMPLSWWNSCKFWPAVTAFTFAVIPPQFRNIFSGLVAIGWQTYLGVLNQRAEKKEIKTLGAAAA